MDSFTTCCAKSPGVNMRAVILGNSGSGKTWLAVQLAKKFGSPIVHLDDIFWQPGGFNEKRDPAEAACLVNAAKSQSDWIAEGVYGNLAQQFLPFASTLVWLEIPWHVCRMRLELRGSEGKAHMGREQSEAGLRELVDWAERYSSRQGSCSHTAHLALFESFQGKRHRLSSESDVLAFLDAA